MIDFFHNNLIFRSKSQSTLFIFFCCRNFVKKDNGSSSMMLCEIFVKDSLKIDCWQRAFSLKKAASCNLMRWEEIYVINFAMRILERCDEQEWKCLLWHGKKVCWDVFFFQVCGIQSKKIENLNLTTDVTFPDHKYCRRHLLLQVHKSAFSHKIYVENKIIFSCENFTPNVL